MSPKILLHDKCNLIFVADKRPKKKVDTPPQA